MLYRAVERFTESMGDRRLTPDVVAGSIRHAQADRHPKPRYVVGVGAVGRLMLPARDLLWTRAAKRIFAYTPS